MYILVYYVKNRGVFEKRFEDYPNEQELQFLAERNDIIKATLWNKPSDSPYDYFRVIDLI